MPLKKQPTRRARRTIYVWRNSTWQWLGERDYLVPVACDEFCLTWPALRAKREQLGLQLLQDPGVHIDRVYGFEI